MFGLIGVALCTIDCIFKLCVTVGIDTTQVVSVVPSDGGFSAALKEAIAADEAKLRAALAIADRRAKLQQAELLSTLKSLSNKMATLKASLHTAKLRARKGKQLTALMEGRGGGWAWW